MSDNLKPKTLGDIIDSFRDYVEEILEKNQPQTNLLIAKAREEKWVRLEELKQKLQQLLAHLEGIGRFDSNNLLVTMNLVAYKSWKKKFEELFQETKPKKIDVVKEMDRIERRESLEEGRKP